jgi:hypothetical protein
VAGSTSKKSKAWAIFDAIVRQAAPEGVHSNPWDTDSDGFDLYIPDFDTLSRLLGVPLYLEASPPTGVPALALDVWVSYELRRAGFDPDEVWPRPSFPRILPAPIIALANSSNRQEREALWNRLRKKTPPKGAAANSASILGKNYLKQVDVVISNWIAGPELLISTKRMDTAFGKNAANRVEESYGDAKNLRLRHPLAALGFVYGLRSTIFSEEPEKAEWLIDLLQKLGREDDAYHAVSLLIIEYDDEHAMEAGSEDQGDREDPLLAAGIEEGSEESSEAVEEHEVEAALKNLPRVELGVERVPSDLQPGRFFSEMIQRVIDATPVTMHKGARQRWRNPSAQ